ncbi:Pleckstrin homology domain-containing protein [Chlamydoabsidia padenii]|nr:Pleckstrin homology domain-containing protein [Chlamydoabsidia padenii]
MGQLCGKLSMKAESQQIDRILEEFSKKYWECNRQSIFGNADIIHAIVYSLVLLNTDLHVVKGERKKMSRPAFIRNTMDAIRSQLKQSQDNNIPILDQNNKSNISAVSLDDDKLASGISTHSQTLKHEWSDLKRTPSCRSAYSQSSSYSGKISSTFDGATTTLISSASFGSTKWQNELESFLKQLYTSVRHKQIMQPESKTINDHRLREATRNTSNGHRYRTFKRNVGTMMWKAARDSLFISDSKFMDVEFPQPSTPRSTLSGRSGSQRRRRRSISSIHSGVSQHSLNTRNNGTVNYQAVASLLHHSDLPTSYTSTAPYYKEGMIVRKHLMEQANQKARQRDWKECFMVVDRGEIRMYRLDGYGQRRKTQAVSSRHPLQGMVSRGASLATVSESIEHSSTSSDLALGGGDWLAHAQVIGEVDLKHTLSNALPSGYSRRRRHAFALQQANGGVYLFQVGSAEQVMEWVTTCNYWAARESKEPLMGGVGNLEYGWGACLDEIQLDDNDDNSQEVYLDPSITVSQWQPPVPPMMASNSNEMTQLETLRQHVKTLNNELDRHRDLKLKMEQKFAQDTPNRICAMTNFQNKTQYLLHEIIKYQNYCDSIETSLVLQDKAIHKENQETHS